jgi:peptidoglycan/LPS O-acetylase OafA/YrhL
MASLAAAFFCGSTLAATHAQRRANPRTTISAGILLVIVLSTGLWLPLGPPVLAVFVVFLGAVLDSGWPSRVGTQNDLSYGVYLYHFPVIQLLVGLGLASSTVAGNLLVLTPAALLLTVPLAAASWHLVEAPAQRYARRRRPAVAAVQSGRV